MRKIKFRLWDKRRKVMDKTPQVYLALQTGRLWRFPEYEGYCEEDVTNKYILMESTTLKDKTGVEIYEGDILMSDTKMPCVVKWNGNGYSAGMFELYPEDYKIIGNIYENPELL